MRWAFAVSSENMFSLFGLRDEEGISPSSLGTCA
jgi:hypothetical protein